MDQSPFRIVTLQNHEIDTRLLNTLFARQEFEVTSFSDALSFIRYMRMQPAAHCLITDLELKQGNGIELIEKVRKDPRWQKVPIVVLAESVDKATLLKLTQLKIKAYIVRPYQPQRLFNDVLKAMGLEVVKETKWVRRVKKETQQSKTPDSD
jgi:CheY-like chemotaxis protein